MKFRKKLEMLCLVLASVSVLTGVALAFYPVYLGGHQPEPRGLIYGLIAAIVALAISCQTYVFLRRH